VRKKVRGRDGKRAREENNRFQSTGRSLRSKQPDCWFGKGNL